MKIEVSHLKEPKKENTDPRFMGYVDVTLNKAIHLRGIKVLRAGHTKWGFDIKVPYQGKSPSISIEEPYYSAIMDLIKQKVGWSR